MSDVALKFHPNGYSILVRVIHQETKFGVIELPANKEEKILRGKILSIGPKVTMFDVGEIVVFRWTSGIALDFVRFESNVRDLAKYKVMTEDEPLGSWEE